MKTSLVDLFYKNYPMKKIIPPLCFASVIMSPLSAQDGVQSGKFIMEPPTLHNLGFEWYIDGDDNRNATVQVEYRIAGSDSGWKQGLPLLRIGDEYIERAAIQLRPPARPCALSSGTGAISTGSHDCRDCRS